jgi:hypothetical protein
MNDEIAWRSTYLRGGRTGITSRAGAGLLRLIAESAPEGFPMRFLSAARAAAVSDGGRDDDRR